MVQTILVPVDVHEESSWRDVLPIGIDQAHHAGAKLYVLTVVEHVEVNMPGVPSPEAITKQRKQAAAESLEALVGNHATKGVEVECLVGQGNVHREVLRAADQIQADLIVMASHRPDLKTYLLGAHAARVVRHANCSVYVVRA